MKLSDLNTDCELIPVWEEDETGNVIVGDLGWTSAELVGYLLKPIVTPGVEDGVPE